MFSIKKLIVFACLVSASLMQAEEQSRFSSFFNKINAAHVGIASGFAGGCCLLKALYHANEAKELKLSRLAPIDSKWWAYPDYSYHINAAQKNLSRTKSFGWGMALCGSYLVGKMVTYREVNTQLAKALNEIKEKNK
jgi:hypothetical protein